MRAFKIYDFTLSAGGAMPLLVEGSYFKIYSCTGVVSVSIDGGSTVGPINAGQGMKTEFSRLTIVDASGAANVGKIIVASNDFVDDRITGEVSVIDGELARSKAGLAFSCYTSISAGAAQFPLFEIWNPAGSGKRVVLSDVLWSNTAANPMYQLNRISVTLGAALVPPSKSSGVAGAPAARYGASTAAAIPGTALELCQSMVNVPLARTFKQPFVIEPNSGIVVASQPVNSGQNAAVQFIEEAV